MLHEEAYHWGRDGTDSIQNRNNDVSLPQLCLSRLLKAWNNLSLSEVSGSLGDLGTFIPLTVALARQDAIYLGPALFLAGLSNVVLGFLWDIPMCVQPMKSIAAVAIAEGLSRSQVTAAGVWMGFLLILLGVTNGIELVNLLVPTPVVSGIQIGVGANLAIRGLVMVQGLSWAQGPDCILFAIACSIFCLYLLQEKPSRTDTQERYPPRQQKASTPPMGLYLFGLGILLASIKLHQTRSDESNMEFGFFGAPIVKWALHDLTWNDWKQGLLEGAIPQLPLTTMNSVISVCYLAHSLYPEKRRGSTENNVSDAVVSRAEACLSNGVMNLIACSFGGLPCCHGAGGLAAQHKFGARSGASVIFLGINKMLLAAVFGGSLLILLGALPLSILGLMLVLSGQELSLRGLEALIEYTKTNLTPPGEPVDRAEHVLDERNKEFQASFKKNAFIVLVTAFVNIGLRKTHYAALSGWITYMVYGDGIRNWRRSRSRDAGEVEYLPIPQRKYRDDPEAEPQSNTPEDE